MLYLFAYGNEIFIGLQQNYFIDRQLCLGPGTTIIKFKFLWYIWFCYYGRVKGFSFLLNKHIFLSGESELEKCGSYAIRYSWMKTILFWAEILTLSASMYVCVYVYIYLSIYIKPWIWQFRTPQSTCVEEVLTSCCKFSGDGFEQ